ncbi:MAG: hypothetical protein M3Q58_15555 [Bacteroidota bacterium]|nr:hypothetical protein [Bacteroidota bacterium]
MKGAGNSYDFGARIYDPRIGRFLSTDAYESTFPGISPYNFALNNPIRFIDNDGNYPFDANLMIIIGNWDNSSVLQEGDWTVVRANSLEAALQAMTNKGLDKGNFDNFLLGTHGGGISDFAAIVDGPGRTQLNSKILQQYTNTNYASNLEKFSRIQAFGEILRYLGSNPTISLGVCCIANHEQFNTLIYNFIESKLGGDFKLYASTSVVSYKKDGDNMKPKYDVKVIKEEYINEGDGFKQITNNGTLDINHNLIINKTNPFFVNTLEFTKEGNATDKAKPAEKDKAKPDKSKKSEPRIL